MHTPSYLLGLLAVITHLDSLHKGVTDNDMHIRREIEKAPKIKMDVLANAVGPLHT